MHMTSTFNHAFMPKPEFESYRNAVKSRHEDDKNIFDINEHQMPDQPRNFMKMIKGKENAM
jgi:hypothetical protein